MKKEQKNTYLEEVFAGSEMVQASLSAPQHIPSLKTRERRKEGEGQLYAKVTGWGPWKNVLVPPNAFVVQTRRGHADPIHCGMGISFRYNPYRDSFLIAPAAMQTIIINANCISIERQGIMVQAYVQWIIDDFSKAYRRLDLSDQRDPMKVTNLQLQQQAEATIKDTVATMSIDEILSDKQPIIEMLTARLRAVAEGSDPKDEKMGLGLRIITVQIKEAIVSSTSLWENLQRGFRAERSKEARLRELKAELTVQEEEVAVGLRMERVNLEREDQIQNLRHENEARAFDLGQSELARRAKLEAEHAVERANHEREILTQNSALQHLELEKNQELQRLRFEQTMSEKTRHLDLLRQELELERETTPEQLQQQLIKALPEIASKLPKPGELKIYGATGADGGQLSRLVHEITDLIQRLGSDQTRI